MDKAFTVCAAEQGILKASKSPYSFLHSDLTYNVPSVWDGRFFRLDDHLNGQADPSGDSRETSIQNAFVEVIVTRGLKWIRDTPLEEMTNNMYMFLQPYIWTSGLSLRARCAACLPVLLTRRLRICSGGSHAGDDRHGQKWAEVGGNRQALPSTELKIALPESPTEELGFSFAELERDPQELVAHGFRPVWTVEDGYPGPLPDDIAEWIDPEGDRTLRLVGPMSSLFWLAKLDDLVDAIDSPDFTMSDEVICVPCNASIQSMLPTLYERGRIPGAVYRNYCYPPPEFSLVAFPLRPVIIPPSVTGSIASYSTRDLFPFCRQQSFPPRVLSARITLKARWKLSCQNIERDFTDSLGGNLLFRGLSRRALYSAMACFLPTVNANHADNEFGPGIYTTPSLELALGYARVQGALMVFQNPDFRTLNVWEPSQDDWRIITTYWLRRTLSNAQERVPPGWDTDVIRGAVSQAGRGRGASRVPGPDTQVVVVSNAALTALAASLKMIIWLE
ncbi:hypothetical protein KXW12_005791 [Aspergillus fumigatus]|nr:hypothetical protein KXW12_005791 [Aspergillus fumigatus]KAH3219944.1 hypothetical protein KXV86_008558 [Aspergillus fumigatus]